MRNLIKILLLAVFLTTYNSAIIAQNSNNQRLTREQLAEVQAKHIAKEMAMDDSTSKKFIATYCQFQKEIWELGPHPKSQQSSTTTDEETEEVIKDRFAHSQKILNIRQKYYSIYGKFLTQKQIQRVYELERQMMNRIRAKNATKR